MVRSTVKVCQGLVLGFRVFSQYYYKLIPSHNTCNNAVMCKQSWTPKLHVSPVFWKNLSVLTTFFQVDLGQPVLIEAKDDGGGGDNWSYKSCKAPVKSSPPTNQQPVFYRPDALPVAQPTVSKHWCQYSSLLTEWLRKISTSNLYQKMQHRLQQQIKHTSRDFITSGWP